MSSFKPAALEKGQAVSTEDALKEEAAAKKSPGKGESCKDQCTQMLFLNVTALQKGQAVLTEDALKEKEAAAKGHEAAAAGGLASKSGDRSASAPRSRRAIEPVNTDEVRPIRMVRGFSSCRAEGRLSGCLGQSPSGL